MQRYVFLLVSVAACGTSDDATVSVTDLVAHGGMSISAGQIDPSTPFAANATLGMDSAFVGCALLADDMHITIDGQDAPITNRGGEHSSHNVWGPDLWHTCKIPTVTLPTTGPASSTIVISDDTTSATIVAGLFAPRTLTLMTPAVPINGQAILTWSPASDTVLDCCGIAFVTDTENTSLDLASVKDSTIVVDLQSEYTQPIMANAGQLAADFKADVMVDRCDLSSCTIEIEQNQNFPISILPPQ